MRLGAIAFTVTPNGPELERELAGERDDSALGGRVGAAARRAQAPSRDRRDVDDLAAALPLHHRRDRVAEEKRPVRLKWSMRCHSSSVSSSTCGGRLRDDGAPADRVHEDVDASVLVDDLLHGAGDLRGVECVGDETVGGATVGSDAADHLIQALLVDLDARRPVPPSRAMISAVARPMPRPTAVISAVRPLNLMRFPSLSIAPETLADPRPATCLVNSLLLRSGHEIRNDLRRLPSRSLLASPDLFTSRAAAGLRDRMPHTTDRPKGPVWITSKGASLGMACGMGSAGREYVPGRIHRSDRMASTGPLRGRQARDPPDRPIPTCG